MTTPKNGLVKLDPNSDIFKVALKDIKVTITTFADSEGKLSDGPYVPKSWVDLYHVTILKTK